MAEILEEVDGDFYIGVVEILEEVDGDFYIGMVEILEEVDGEFYSGEVDILEVNFTLVCWKDWRPIKGEEREVLNWI